MGMGMVFALAQHIQVFYQKVELNGTGVVKVDLCTLLGCEVAIVFVIGVLVNDRNTLLGKTGYDLFHNRRFS
jgi:hypothetical protein